MALRRSSSLTGTDAQPDSRSWPRVAGAGWASWAPTYRRPWSAEDRSARRATGRRLLRASTAAPVATLQLAGPPPTSLCAVRLRRSSPCRSPSSPSSARPWWSTTSSTWRRRRRPDRVGPHRPSAEAAGSTIPASRCSSPGPGQVEVHGHGHGRAIVEGAVLRAPRRSPTPLTIVVRPGLRQRRRGHRRIEVDGKPSIHRVGRRPPLRAVARAARLRARPGRRRPRRRTGSAWASAAAPTPSPRAPTSSTPRWPWAQAGVATPRETRDLRRRRGHAVRGAGRRLLILGPGRLPSVRRPREGAPRVARCRSCDADGTHDETAIARPGGGRVRSHVHTRRRRRLDRRWRRRPGRCPVDRQPAPDQ